MKMRWFTLAVIGAFLVPAALLAQGANRNAAPGGPKPVIEIPVTSHDFGEVYKQDKYLHAFAVYNRGNGDLIIEEVKPG